MEAIHRFLHFVMHVDPATFAEFLRPFGLWAYGILFAIIFCETGLVVTPFLPGDSLLFAAGAFSATGSMNTMALFLLLAGAAIVGDNVNYWFGRYIGPRAFSGDYRFLKKKHLDRTHEFYEKHGPGAVILARFVPIVRTFAPFVAGVGAIQYRKFLLYDTGGGLAWVGLFIWTGYFIGSLPFVKQHFHVVILAIIAISVMPIVVEVLRTRLRRA